MRQHSGSLLVIFNSGRRKVGPRFHLFISHVDQLNKGAGCIQDYLRGGGDGKTLVRSYGSC